MEATFLSHDISGLVSSIPLPVLVLALIVLVLVFFGLLSRIRTMLQGHASPLDYAGMALLLFFFLLVAIILAKATFRGISLP